LRPALREREHRGRSRLDELRLQSRELQQQRDRRNAQRYRKRLNSNPENSS